MIKDNQGVTPPHLRNLSNIQPTIDNLIDKHSNALTIGEGDRSELLRVINPETLKQALFSTLMDVIGEDEDLNAPLDRTVDHNPESDRYPDLYLTRRATRNIMRAEQRASLRTLFGVDDEKYY